MSPDSPRAIAEPQPPRLLRLDEAAEVLAVSPQTLWTLSASGEVPVVRVGRRSVRFDLKDLLSYIERRKARVPGP